MNHYHNIFTKGTRLPPTLALDYKGYSRDVLLFLFLVKNDEIRTADFNGFGMTMPERVVRRINSGKRFFLEDVGNGKWHVLKNEDIHVPEIKPRAARIARKARTKDYDIPLSKIMLSRDAFESSQKRRKSKARHLHSIRARIRERIRMIAEK